jgi:hypothetical protein
MQHQPSRVVACVSLSNIRKSGKHALTGTQGHERESERYIITFIMSTHRHSMHPRAAFDERTISEACTSSQYQILDDGGFVNRQRPTSFNFVPSMSLNRASEMRNPCQ